MCRPAGVLATQIAPTDTAYTVWQPWFLRPSLSRVVTSPCPGYACRPNRAIDGRGLSPHKMRSLVGCSPNARRQARLEAGATQERTLAAVACTPWLGPALASTPPGWVLESDPNRAAMQWREWLGVESCKVLTRPPPRARPLDRYEDRCRLDSPGGGHPSDWYAQSPCPRQ
jgi:hypothetical protein